MKECQRDDLIGESCRLIEGVDIKSCLLYQLAQLENPEDLPHIRRVAMANEDCGHIKKVLELIDNKANLTEP